MWNAVLFMGLVMATDPIRLGLAVVLVTRKRPMLNLFAFWLGGVVAGVGLALWVLVVIRDAALVVIKTANAAISDFRSTVIILEGPRLHITVGLIALGAAIHMVAKQRAQSRAALVAPVEVPVPVGVGGGHSGDGESDEVTVIPPDLPGLFARMAAISHNMLNRDGFVWPAFVVGLTSSAPPIESVAALTVIMASGAALGVQIGAFLVFILLVLTVIEVPLIANLVFPRQTQAVLLRINEFLCVHRRKIMLGTMLIMGVGFLGQGVYHLVVGA